MYDDYRPVDLILPNFLTMRNFYETKGIEANDSDEDYSDWVEGAAGKALILGCFDAAAEFKGRTKRAVHVMPHISHHLDYASEQIGDLTALAHYLMGGGVEIENPQYTGGIVGKILRYPELSRFDQFHMATMGEYLLNNFELSTFPVAGGAEYLHNKRTALGQMEADYQWLNRFLVNLK